MSSNATTIHPIWLRVSHWINALAVVLMVMSGWRIYDASPIFSFSIPTGWTLGGWLAGALQWHFAAMWLLVGNGIFYLGMNSVTGRIKRKYFPLRPRDLWGDFRKAMTGKLEHGDLSQYNAVQKLAYLVVVLDLIVLVLSGLVIWKSVQFPLLRDVMGGYDNARIVHFVAMSIVVAFVFVHLVMVALVPKSFLTMVRGR
ncbi:MAG: cytochrome B [Burkholderiales bacterium]|jgi:thiosulfate reductase cytochrome b subunit|nr:cytochrome B [Burkholderiales bacterium]